MCKAKTHGVIIADYTHVEMRQIDITTVSLYVRGTCLQILYERFRISWDYSLRDLDLFIEYHIKFGVLDKFGNFSDQLYTKDSTITVQRGK